MIDYNFVSIIGFCVCAVIISAMSTFKHYMPHPKKFKDLFTGKCGLSLFVMISFIANLGGSILGLCGYNVGGL